MLHFLKFLIMETTKPKTKYFDVRILHLCCKKEHVANVSKYNKDWVERLKNYCSQQKQLFET